VPRQASTGSHYGLLIVFLFYFWLLIYPALSFLWRHSYPFFSVEVGLIFLLIAICSILLAIIIRNVRPVIANALSLLLITVILMLQFNLLLPGLIVLALIGPAAIFLLKGRFQLYSLAIIIFMIAGAFFDSFEDDGNLRSTAKHTSAKPGLPPVVHILMDSFIGIDGLPPHAESDLLRDEIYTFFDQYDFHTFPRAYSRYLSTGNSVYKAFNYQNDGKNKFGLEVLGRRKHILKPNAQFDVMQELGYRFNIYQTEFLDFCQSNVDHVDRCWQYSQPNVDSISHAPDMRQRLEMLAVVLLNQSTILSNLVTSIGLFMDGGMDRGIAHHDPRVFANLERDLLSDPGGKYFFAHILLPHGPFAFQDDCSINYESSRLVRFAALQGEPLQNKEIYETRTKMYFEQVSCALKSMHQIFEKMKAAGIYEQSIIVIHGDHGSRIGKYYPHYGNIGVLTHSEYRANFSTLFAVKFPGIKGHHDQRALPLSTLLEEFSVMVQKYNTGQEITKFMQSLPETAERVDSYVYVEGVHPMQRININLFEE